ncbi:Wzz/FepE/Etk N-terminal domain-containing protein [Marinobacter manganoxydans]|uniref:Lipopolysaccharide biosynthesis protein n=1 Tax=Marinobacter manganoxydans MnI7-9 TaxID=1094979 RepID=G6YP47_9GAMM|nr:Wzz/FepE/Etk N-terminal domain-containing protein [Marinobacter manganoxydans]EHJ06109.1 lipopolysaccharide biosynthesis protein [Marinobacter manganoxydans MnI7-9]
MEDKQRSVQSSYDHEISLVDLASTFLKRRRIFYLVFLVSLAAGVLYAMLLPEKYDYVSLFRLAEKESGNFIEKPAIVIATLENRWLPDIEALHQAEQDQSIPFEVRFSNPENTGLIRIVSEGTPAQEEGIKRVHRQLIEKLQQTQSVTVSRLQENLERQIESLTSTIGKLEGSWDAGAALADTVEKRLSLEAVLSSIQPAEQLLLNRQSAERKGPARSLIVVLAAMLGLMGGIFLSFFAEFVSLVRANLNEM